MNLAKSAYAWVNQFHESKVTEPAWVVDHDIWNKAKAAVDKAKTPPENYFAVVTTVYKNMGGKVKAQSTKTEADSSSSNTQFLRADPKHSPKKMDTLAKHDHLAKGKECEVRFLVSKIRESATGGKKGSAFEVYLIEEGLGNLKDLFFYPAETLQNAAGIFTGKKIYADHPDAMEEETRPERSVKDILGYFQEVEPYQDETGRTCLKGLVKIVDGEDYDWARALMQEAVEYSKKFEDQEFVGLSVNASGEADEVDIEDLLDDSSIPDASKVKLGKALAQGATTVRKVSAITDAVSCDLVTEAGAGGKVLAMIEQEKKMRTKTKKKNLHESELKHAETENEDDKGKDGAADPSGDHPDADKDKALIGDMMKKYMGKKDGEEVDESEADMCKQALKHAEEMGYEGEEKIHAAGYGMKMMKHAAMKHAEKIGKESEGEESEAEGEESEAEAEESEGKTPSGVAADKMPTKEAAKMVAKLEKENLELKGRVAKLEESGRKVELEKYLDKKLKESGLPMSVTKKFREGIKVLRNEKDIDEKWSIFSEAYKAGSESSESPLTLGTEKVRESSSDDEGGSSSIDMTKCLR